MGPVLLSLSTVLLLFSLKSPFTWFVRRWLHHSSSYQTSVKLWSNTWRSCLQRKTASSECSCPFICLWMYDFCCLSDSITAWLSVYLSVCEFVAPPICLTVSKPGCLSVCLWLPPVYLTESVLDWLSVCLPVVPPCLSDRISAWLAVCLSMCCSSCLADSISARLAVRLSHCECVAPPVCLTASALDCT